MFEQNASKIVCIDSIHRTNQYAFSLITILVPDEFNKGYPVGHLLSNREDESTIKPFLEEIKKRCSKDIEINVVMSDDDNASRSAFKTVFNAKRDFLCKWHVKKAWGKKIGLAGTKKNQDEIYQVLETLIDERDKERQLLSSAIARYQEKCPNFVNHFNENYVGRTEKWALCYRNFPHANTDTNMFVELFHNKLKTFYVDRGPNKRDLLLVIEEDYYSRHKRDTFYNNPETKVGLNKANKKHVILKVYTYQTVTF